ncbi:prepilin peptidase [Pseudonocardia lacus]|uniref:prepilin peptidase n=1 Tax=Pseudonocardia lacus TaxID=2835865 RepID=UPI001BDC4632|nr:A24 family peptidase [Pseudonocardia lacus]
MTPPEAAVVTNAVAAAVVGGPAVILLAHGSLMRPFPPGAVDRAAAGAAAGLAVAALAARGPALAIVGLPLIVFGLAAASVDALERRLPDRLTGPLLICTAVAVLGVALIIDDLVGAVRAAAAGVLLTGITLALKGVRSAAIGWGDVKLMPGLGAALGWASWDALLTAAVLWALLITLTAVFGAGSGRDDVVPYGPALLAGALGGLAVAG